MLTTEIHDRITLNISQTDKFKTNFLSIFFSTPLDAGTSAEYALIPKVLMRASSNYPDMKAINQRLDYLYGANISATTFKRGERQVTAFFVSCLCNEYAFEKMDILKDTILVTKDLLFNPLTKDGGFMPEFVESEKKNQIDFITSQKNNKNQYAITRCQQEMCKDEPFGLSEYGTVEQVQAINEKTLFKAYEKFMATADIDVFFIGRCDSNSLTDQINDMFSSIKRDKVPAFTQEIITHVDKVTNIEEEMNINQGKLTLGFRTGATLCRENYAAFSLFNEIFGGSPSSKLFMNVREKLSLCYYCRAIAEAHKGLLFVASGIEVENKQKAQDEILSQLEDIKNGKISDAEFSSAVKSLINGYSELNDDPQSLSLWYFNRGLAGVYDTPEEVCEKINSITKEQVVEAAQNVKLDTVYFLKGAKA